ncbi:MAG TPA: tetratricopeptide repeat protein [Pyrinomonadaceae bacterium]|jgi:CHAT domain-containing protein/Tfp pilus assembly protein PilF|nr:tetratricopeptide repeat protein [Pyrinomonadaceae bacterium]
MRFILPQILIGILLYWSLWAQPPPDIHPLSLGQPIERELKGDEAHSYTVAVNSGQYLHVVVDQRGIDVVVALFGIDGKKLAEVDSPNGSQGPEPISVIVETSGNYRLEVRSLEKMATTGRYEVKIEELRTATEKDKKQFPAKLAARNAFAEGEALRSQGTAESLRGAIKKYEEALPLYRSAGDKDGAAIALNNIGKVYSDLGEQQQALKVYNEALLLHRAVGDKHSEAFTLNNIGLVYYVLGERQRALKFYNESLPLSREVGDRQGEAQTLTNIGGVYSDLGQKQQALKFFSESLLLFRAVDDKSGEASTINRIGVIYSVLGEQQQALKFFNESLLLFWAVEDKSSEASTITNIGAIYSALGEHRQALKVYNEALLLHRAVGDKRGEAFTLNNIGKVYSDLGEQQQALNFYSEALPLIRAIGDKYGEAQTLNNIGKAHSDLGEQQKALSFYNEALSLLRLVDDKRGEAQTLNNIFVSLASGNPRLGVFFGKQSVNNFQILRSNVQGLDKDIQQTFLKSIEKPYRRLADALLAQGRLAEAQQVFNLFKDQQYFDFNSSMQATTLALTMRENESVATFNQKLERIVAVIRQLEGYKRTIGSRAPNKPEAEQIQIYEVDLKAANDEYLAFLKQAENDFSGPPSDKDSVGEIADTKEMQATLRDLQSQTGQRAVVIYTLEATENYRGLLITPDKIEAVSYPIKAGELRQKAVKFFGQLSEVDNQTNPPKFSKSEVQKTGKELYEIVFAPVAAKLKELGLKPDVLMWSLDGALRYLPVAALYDGKQYLAERYRNIIFTRASSERMLSPVSPVWTGSGFYSSKEYSLPVRSSDNGKIKLVAFKGLKNAKTEVEAIFSVPPKRGIIGGDLLSNEQFTKDSLYKALKLNRPLVHIASHFQFEAGDASLSFLLLGDSNKLTLEDIKNAPDDLFNGVELLTLSACETGVQKERESDGREIDSFAELAQRKGAKAVLASLWKVDDDSTSRLMAQFYRIRESKKLTKAEALQEAQLTLLNSKDFSHPYYWAPFILTGNWR